MTLPLKAAALGILAAAAMAVAAIASDPAEASGRDRTYSVKITNLTKGQVLTPPAVIAHRSGYQLFEVTGAASEGLTTLAETGFPGTLVDEAVLNPRVSAAEVGGGVIPPGQSIVVEITADRWANELSVAAMLATTNDAFAAVRGLDLPRYRGHSTATGNVYDAGTEANNELCDFIPGPPCGDAMNERDTGGAEGFIHIHNGIHGIADLAPADLDWRNPAMKVEITRTRGDD